jgi:hypothetical protein
MPFIHGAVGKSPPKTLADGANFHKNGVAKNSIIVTRNGFLI